MKEKKTNAILLWLPIMLMIAIMPLVMRISINYPDEHVIDIFNQTLIAEPYIQYKKMVIIILSIAMLVIVFLFGELVRLKKVALPVLIGSGIFFGISLISTFMSNYSNVAWWGVPDRAEGMVMTACYILMMYYTIYAFTTQNDSKYLIFALSFLIFIFTIIGICDFVGYNLFTKNKFFMNLMIGNDAREMGLVELTNDYEMHKVIGTMVHYNYVGSFGAMILPFNVILMLLLPTKQQKLFFGILTICSSFILFGSTSRAGLIGLAVIIIVTIIIFIKQIIKRWPITLSLIAVGIVGIIGLNLMTGGVIFDRVPMLIDDIVGILKPADKSFNYINHIPMRNIYHEDKSEVLVFQNATLVINTDYTQPIFTDDDGNTVVYKQDDDGVLRTDDSRFNNVTFTYNQILGVEEGYVAPIMIEMALDGVPTFHFIINSEDGVVMSDICPIQIEELEFPETWGFYGKERLGSARGYIWSRAIPMMKSTWLIGNGPDTFALSFPQRDYLGKWWAYGTPNMIVDKPHNLYMMFFINNGGLALIGFLILVGYYLFDSFRLYAFKEAYTNNDALGIAMMLAIVGYLGAGFFNDSIIAIAPIFWIILGSGLAVNSLNKTVKVV